MNFNHNWGLGSSSTLIHNLSKWADVEPFSVYWKVTSGSGYDLASCKYDKPIIYQLIKSETPKIESVNFFLNSIKIYSSYTWTKNKVQNLILNILIKLIFHQNIYLK